MEQICSTFVFLTYIIAFVKVFQRKGKPLNLEEYFPLDPMNCLPRQIIALAQEKPQLWKGVRIPRWGQIISHKLGFDDPQTHGYIKLLTEHSKPLYKM